MSADLYQEALVALAKLGKAGERLDDPDGTATSDNPLCGDRVTVDLKITDGHISGLGQKTRGCILTQAASALMADMANGLASDEAAHLLSRLRVFLKDGCDEKFDVMEPVRSVKSRHDCVLIAFQALADAVEATKRGNI